MTKQISPLRQRMIDDMALRNMSPNTQKIYTYAVANFSAFHRRSPDKLGLEDVRDYHLHLVSRKLKPNSINPIMGALRFFYGTTLGRKHVADQIPYARRADTLPAVLARLGWEGHS
jgi:integrase/recombinase XerD